jgi:hypothetical protein
LRANWQVYGDLLRKTRSATGLRDKLRVWWEPAHWQPPGAGLPAPELPEPRYDPRAQQRYDPPMSAAGRRAALAAFVLLLGATAATLWWAHLMAPWQQALCLIAVAAGMSGVGRLCSATSTAHASAEAHAKGVSS